MSGFRIPRTSPATVIRRVALAYLIVWVLSPPLAYGNKWRVVAVIAMLAWLALDLARERSVVLRPSLPMLALVAYVGYTLAVHMLVPDITTINDQFQLWIMLFFLVIGEHMRRAGNADARFCFWLILLVLPIWSITTLHELIAGNAHAARLIIRSSADAEQLTNQGIGGYSFVYATVLCLPFLAYLSLHPGQLVQHLRGHWRRRLAYGLVLTDTALGIALVLYAGYSTAVLLMSASLLLVIMIRSRKQHRLAGSIYLLLVVVFVGWFARMPILGALHTNIYGTATGLQYEQKITDIEASMQTDNSVGTVEDRTERYMRSARLFVEHPLIGTLRRDNVGKHSAILDRLAEYGIVFGWVFIYLIGYVPWRSLRDKQVPMGLALSFLAVAIAYPLVNNVFMEWGLILYVFSRGALSVMGLPLSRPMRALREKRTASSGFPMHA